MSYMISNSLSLLEVSFVLCLYPESGVKSLQENCNKIIYTGLRGTTVFILSKNIPHIFLDSLIFPKPMMTKMLGRLFDLLVWNSIHFCIVCFSF